jgi:hypothetical protein
MVVTAVQSATLSSTVYDASRQLLWLEFQSGAVYCYFGVPPKVHQDLISAPPREDTSISVFADVLPTAKRHMVDAAGSKARQHTTAASDRKRRI